MTWIKEPKWFVFKENTYKFLKINSIGYNDFGIRKTSGFLTTNVWHALYFVRSGNGSFTIRNKTYALGPGSLFFITPNEPVIYDSDEDDPIRYYWFAIYEDFAAEISHMLGFTEEKPIHPAKEPQQIIEIFEKLLEAPTASAETYFASLSALMQLLSLEFSKVEHIEDASGHQAFAENVKQQIDLNYTNPEFHVEAVAHLLYVSHAHMSRVFKEIMGMTPVKYLIEVRLNHAAKLLQDPDITVKAMCEACGFSDEWHFMKSFKKKFGMTVNEYKKGL